MLIDGKEWKLVPVEPTDEMRDAGWRTRYEGHPLAHIYRAMISAAPTPPDSGAGEGSGRGGEGSGSYAYGQLLYAIEGVMCIEAEGGRVVGCAVSRAVQ